MNHKTNNADWRNRTCGECIHGSPEKLSFWYGLTESETELVISGNESILPHKVANGIGCGTEKRGCVFETFSPACPAFVAREEDK